MHMYISIFITHLLQAVIKDNSCYSNCCYFTHSTKYFMLTLLSMYSHTGLHSNLLETSPPPLCKSESCFRNINTLFPQKYIDIITHRHCHTNGDIIILDLPEVYSTCTASKLNKFNFSVYTTYIFDTYINIYNIYSILNLHYTNSCNPLYCG